jgi:hypothetical protein
MSASGRGMQQHESSSGRGIGSAARGGPYPQGSGRAGRTGRGERPAKHKSTAGRLQSEDGPGRSGGQPPTSPGRLKATIGSQTRTRAPAQARGATTNGQDRPRRGGRSVSPKPSRSPSPPPRARPRGGMGGWALGKPSKALQGAYQKEGLPEAVSKASKSLLKKKMAREGTAPAKDINVLSLRLSEEPLLDGASKVGSITLSIDAWWMDDNALPTLRQSPVL